MQLSKYLFIAIAGSALAFEVTTASAAPVIKQVELGSTTSYTQTSDSNVSLDSPGGFSNGGPGGPVEFHVEVKGTNIGAIVPPTVSGPFSATVTGTSWFDNGTLHHESPSSNSWRLGNPHPNWYEATLSALNSNFGDGVYTLNVNGSNFGLNYSGTIIPDTVPLLAVTGGSWSNGNYVIAANQTLTITTNAYTGYGSHLDDGVGTFVDGPSPSFTGVADSGQLHSTTPGQNFSSLTIAANTLVAGQRYLGGAQFLALTDNKLVSSLPNSFNFAANRNETDFKIVVVSAVPVPPATLLFGSGLLGLVGMRRHKSRQS